MNVEVTGDASVKVNWEIPSDTKGTIKNFFIQATAKDGGQINATALADEIFTTVSTLTPFEEYDITVTTVNDQLEGNGGGPGEPSLPVKAKTWPARTFEKKQTHNLVRKYLYIYICISIL